MFYRIRITLDRQMNPWSFKVVACLFFFGAWLFPYSCFGTSTGTFPGTVFGEKPPSLVYGLPVGEFLSAKRARPETETKVSLIAVGDIMLSRYVARKIAAVQDAHYVFRKVRDYLSRGDIVFGNLECPIAAGRKIGTGEMVFRAEPGIETVLKKTGFTVLSLANNHMPDFGERGVNETLHFLNTAGMQSAGAGSNDWEAYSAALVEAKGFRFAFLAYNDHDVVPPRYQAGPERAGTALMDIPRLTAAVREARHVADFVVVSMHSGHEYTKQANASQTAFAHAAIDAGAELVIGHHPHVVQPVEQYRGKYILYSLGNFVFDQARTGTRDGIIATCIFDKSGLSRIELFPVTIEEFCRPRFVDPVEFHHITDRLLFPLNDRPVFTWNHEKMTLEQADYDALYLRDFTPGNRSKKMSADLDCDGSPESYFLHNGKLRVAQGPHRLWESPPDWWIEDYVLEDSTHDGAVDLNLTAWTLPPPCDVPPLWPPGDVPRLLHRFMVYEVRHGIPELLWASSALPGPIYDMAVADINNDSRNEVVFIEGSYPDGGGYPWTFVTLWEWDGREFSRIWRSRKGEYRSLKILCIEGIPHIATAGKATETTMEPAK